MDQNDSPAVPKNQNDPYESIVGELLYPVAGCLVAFVMWLSWIAFGADLVRERIEEGAVKTSGKTGSFSAESSRSPLSPASAPSENLVAGAAQGEGVQNSLSEQDKAKTEDQQRRQAISDRFSQLGQTGDLFGGVNALFAAIALIGVFWAATMQWRSLTEGRRAAAEQRFETMFFELLRLTREVLERVEVPMPRAQNAAMPGSTSSSFMTKSGASALNALASRYFSDYPVATSEEFRPFFLQQLVNRYKTRVYQANPSALGPYFRLLFQTFDLVANAKIDEGKRVRYSNIARGQISDGAVLLLALNGLTWRGWKFVPLIERFGLLEHMHQRYLRKYLPLLRVAYRERAFQGSALRDKASSEPAPKLGPYEFDVDPTSPDFAVTAPMSVPPDEGP
ncbi:putative phage abortive infection protein [Variovorax sp. CY25R-8]|uniref:putative phage abortive infection protein n=1 Tax=Variovorax sp. CY25R-8 TaxID=2855501 RepID=UPI0021BAE960|nr:putative phage abortive infection protein [Variovorax sp. CY25R-8]MCT8174348.1 putative phage abortive infection protein [Variovorax sp. CY25R-8]